MAFINLAQQKTKEIWPNVHASFGHSEKITMARITLEKGALVAEHKHIHEQWSVVLEGELEFTVSGETQLITPGMVVYIPSNELHSVKAVTQCLAMDVFSPAREDFK
ncbi:MAG: cupin domain-containing protein [Bacteroidia bacterium]|nr:cupin domain-containing protein [Bacteroidia bacterium]